jgi:hypothetical protein
VVEASPGKERSTDRSDWDEAAEAVSRGENDISDRIRR